MFELMLCGFSILKNLQSEFWHLKISEVLWVQVYTQIFQF